MPDAAVGLGDTEDMVVGRVPHGTCFIGHGGVDLILLVGIECRSECDHLGENRHVIVADTVTGFVPPVVSRDVETVDGHRPIHHKSDLLFGSEKGKEILNPLVDIEAGVLERILVTLAGGKKHCRGQDKD